MESIMFNMPLNCRWMLIYRSDVPALFLTKRIRHFVDHFASFGVNGDISLTFVYKNYYVTCWCQSVLDISSYFNYQMQIIFRKQQTSEICRYWRLTLSTGRVIIPLWTCTCVCNLWWFLLWNPNPLCKSESEHRVVIN